MKKGFTLAEVLITLGVIGVVAALTMPNLLQNHQKKVFVAQLQRTVNLISNSATALMGDNNAATLSDSYLVPVGDDYKNAQGKFMNTYFKVARDCGTDNREACLGDLYYSLDRSSSTDIEKWLSGSYYGGPYYCVTINTGATICMSPMHPSDDSWHGASSVIVDVNGPSGPNTNGRDLFQFDLYSDGKIAATYDTQSDDWARKNMDYRNCFSAFYYYNNYIRKKYKKTSVYFINYICVDIRFRR